MLKLFYILICYFITHSHGLDNGLALTPPMGWLSWERYRCTIDCKNYPTECISEDLFKRAADLMVSEGFLDAGYEYVIIDDCWLANERDENGRLQPDPERFPSGIKALADYVHKKGLKFGIYEDYGTKTCAGYPGILGHLEIDAKTFADWEVDYVKIDGCNANISTFAEGYTAFGKYLNETGRPIVYQCQWSTYEEINGIHSDYAAISKTCNLWRNYGDIQDSWDSLLDVLDFFGKHQDRFIPYAGPGHWNDPDMIIIGNYGLTYDQSRAQMALWTILSAPLLLSTDLTSIRPAHKEILLNKDIIAINKDPLAIQGRRVYKEKKIEVWTRPISPIIDGYYSYAICILNRNRNEMPTKVNFTLSDLGLNATNYNLQDLFDPDKDPINPVSVIQISVNPSGVKFYKAYPFEINKLL
ncbi:alpha-N-acetylgalactosaminidase-like [Chrysoperla carnea]|uniref:alpha-N-acetylgalactosaminidase-like n=1 Tax=Chrysoperla carnea TaxID=189513 RepID=UPI001D0733F8|nr:alpha-N-acetylgalactosaminidase-like [Chrysoperla carnea]